MRDEEVDVERFTVWQYLIERLGAKRAHSVKQVSDGTVWFWVVENWQITAENALADKI